jgi:hypothetical protein
LTAAFLVLLLTRRFLLVLLALLAGLVLLTLLALLTLLILLFLILLIRVVTHVELPPFGSLPQDDEQAPCRLWRVLNR